MTGVPPPPPPHWASISENTFLGGIRLLFWLHRHLGALPFKLCLLPVVAGYWLFNTQARRASLAYLRRLHAHTGAAGRPPGWRDSLRHFLAFGQAILDKLLAMSGDPPPVHKQGTEGLLALLAQKRGAVLITAHMGCLELCRISAEHNQRLHKLNVLVHTAHAQRFNQLLQQMHPNSPVQLLQVTDFSAATAIMLAQKIEQGEFIAIAGDRIPVNHKEGAAGMTVPVDFLGQTALLPAGPYVLAATLQCPLYAIACIRTPQPASPHQYTMFAHPIAQQAQLPRAQRAQALAAYAQQYAHWLEGMTQQAPLAWFNFFDFWGQGQSSARSASAQPSSGTPTP